MSQPVISPSLGIVVSRHRASADRLDRVIAALACGCLDGSVITGWRGGVNMRIARRCCPNADCDNSISGDVFHFLTTSTWNIRTMCSFCQDKKNVSQKILEEKAKAA
jgi:hypothetical protein